MTGCVYIASMEGVKGRLKIGCTSGDPHDRIADWGKDTGAPGKPILEYAAYLNADPQPVEAAVHRGLKSYRQKGEWFKVDIAVAVRKVRDVAGNQIIEEFDRKDAIAKAERIRKQEEQRKRERVLKEEKRKKTEDELYKKAEGLLRIRLNRNPIQDSSGDFQFPENEKHDWSGLVRWIFNSRENRPTIEQCLEEVREGVVIIPCTYCKTKNRVPVSKSNRSKCGKVECGQPLPKF